MLHFSPPPRGSLAPNSDVDPLKYYYAPIVGRVFIARINLGLKLLDGAASQARIPRILEVGFGSGLLLPTLARGADLVDGIDATSEPSEVRAALGRMGIENLGYLVKGDARRMPFPDDSYDLVVAFSILEHLPGEALGQAIAEAARVLKRGGRFLVGCPAVHRGMNLAFAAIGFRGIEEHHVSSIHDVMTRAKGRFSVEKTATLPPGVPLGWAPYNAVLLRKN